MADLMPLATDIAAAWLVVGIIVAEAVYQTTKSQRPNLRRWMAYLAVVIAWPQVIVIAARTARQARKNR